MVSVVKNYIPPLGVNSVPKPREKKTRKINVNKAFFQIFEEYVDEHEKNKACLIKQL